MDTYSENGNDSDNVIEIWSRNRGHSTISDDPLEDLLNEFGTESTENQTFAWEEELLESLSKEESSLELERPSEDYFYHQLFNKNETEIHTLDELGVLVNKARYLSNKLKYYNTYLLNRE